jgi:hypothetical protein
LGRHQAGSVWRTGAGADRIGQRGWGLRSHLAIADLPSLTTVEAALDGWIAAGSVVCSNGRTAYVKAAVTAGAEHRRVMVPTIAPAAVKVAPVRTKRRQKGRLGLGRVNGRCRGVATRHLDNYLGWHRAMLRTGFTGKALLDRALA